VNSVTGEVTVSGEVTLAALVDRYGPLPATLSQRTGGGGRQLLFCWQGERIRNRAGDLGPGLDTRGVKPDGEAAGYIVLPPSPHISGRRYK
jgi:Bifunctional DNA primase/polymerase, N-terminal